jgi:hypothetical protein
MNTQIDNNSSVGDVVNGAGEWLVALGTLTMTLFPFAVPGIVLTLAAVVPLVLLTMVLGLLAAVAAAPVLVIRAALRRGGRARVGAAAGTVRGPRASGCLEGQTPHRGG